MSEIQPNDDFNTIDANPLGTFSNSPPFPPEKQPRAENSGRISMARVVDCLRKSQGLISHAARAIPCSVNALTKRIAKYPHLQRIVYECREELVDIAELSLRRKCLDGEPWAVVFALGTLGKNRGYTREEQTPQGPRSTTGALMHDGQPASIRDLIGSLSSRPDFLEYAQDKSAKRCVPIGVDSTPATPLITASLISGNPGLHGSNGEQREVGTGESSEKG